MTAVIIDDEPLARYHLKRMLEVQRVTILGEGSTGIDALELSESLHPDLIFLDIQMPDLTGLNAAAALGQMENPPLIVFATGHSEHAAKAFEYAAFDYLLKPVEADRLAITLTRAARSLDGTQPNARPIVKPKDLTPSQRLPVRTDYAIKLIRVDDIDFAVAKDKKVFIRAGGVDQKTYYSLSQLQQILPEEEFIRIHASAIVRISRIEELNFLGNHSYSTTLTGGVTLPVGRAYYAELQKRLGISGD